jgi:hypothetical protein
MAHDGEPFALPVYTKLEKPAAFRDEKKNLETCSRKERPNVGVDGSGSWCVNEESDLQKSFQSVDPFQGLPVYWVNASSIPRHPGCMYPWRMAALWKIDGWFAERTSYH